MRRGLAVLDHLSALAVPTLAVIHGACLGGGLELALACRRRVALASAAPIQVGMPEVHFGLIPAWGGISRIPRIVGPDDGLNLLITGRTIGYLLGPVARHRRPARLRRRLDRIARLALVRSRDRTDLAERRLGRRPGTAPGNGSTSSRGSTRRPSSRSSRSSRSTSPTVVRPPAKRPSKPWPRWPCRTTSAITWPRSSIAAKIPQALNRRGLGRSIATVAQLRSMPISSPSPIM